MPFIHGGSPKELAKAIFILLVVLIALMKVDRTFVIKVLLPLMNMRQFGFLLAYFKSRAHKKQLKISLKAENATIHNVFTKITKRYGLTFIYDPTFFKGFKRVKFAVKDAYIGDVLKQILKKRHKYFRISIKGRVVVIRKKKNFRQK
jgi:hypothetical protein